MRKPCPRCKSSDTRVISPKMMSCRNCGNTWGLYSGASASGVRVAYSNYEKVLPKRKNRKNNSS